MMLSEAIQMFRVSRQADGYAANTVKNNHHLLTRVLSITGDIEVASMTASHVDVVMACETERGLAPGSLNEYVSTLSAFSKWCRAREYMRPEQNPVAGRRYRKDPPKQRDMIPLSLFPAVLDAAENPRDRYLMALGLYTMGRQSEVKALRVRDLDLQSGYLSVTVFKTKETDRIPISVELDRESRRWLTAYTREVGPLRPDHVLVPSYRSVGFQQWELCPTSVVSKPEDLVKRTLRRAGWVPQDWTGMHLLRRSSARALFDELSAKGYDGALRQVQTWLHHSSSTMTERYLGLTVDREVRDKETRGLSMFPSLADSGVVALHQVAG
jgi:integrase